MELRYCGVERLSRAVGVVLASIFVVLQAGHAVVPPEGLPVLAKQHVLALPALDFECRTVCERKVWVQVAGGVRNACVQMRVWISEARLGTLLEHGGGSPPQVGGPRPPTTPGTYNV